jgi:hypothetical protein
MKKFALTLHVVCSVGWFGAVAAFLALAVGGLAGGDRAAYASMDSIARWVIVPFAFASLATGIVQSLVTPWGVFRHYWIVAKLAITVLATLLLLVHMQPIGRAAVAPPSGAEFRGLQIQLVVDAGAAMAALLAAAALAVYKPRGLTPYGRRKQLERLESPRADPGDGAPRWVYPAGFVALALALLFLALHLVGAGLGGHG